MYGNINFEKTKKTKFKDNERRDPKRDKGRKKDFSKQRENKRGSYE